MGSTSLFFFFSSLFFEADKKTVSNRGFDSEAVHKNDSKNTFLVVNIKNYISRYVTNHL